MVWMEDIETMAAYQGELINLMIYEPVKTNKKSDSDFLQKITDEIRRVEVWLKENTAKVVHDKNRQLVT